MKTWRASRQRQAVLTQSEQDLFGAPRLAFAYTQSRITLDAPSPADILCTVSTLTLTDLAASKLLANADRHADDGIFSRDLIDLAMMNLDLAHLRQALAKAESAYGQAIRRDLNTAIERMHQRPG